LASSPKSDRASERIVGDGKLQLAPLMRYDYRVIAPIAWSDRVMGKDWADLADLPWLATPLHSAHRRLTDDVFRALGALPKRVAFTDQEEAVIDFVESGLCLGLARDGILDRVTRKRDFVIADKVTLTCDLSFACLASRRHEDMIAHAFSAMQAVWDVTPSGTPPAPIEAAGSRKGAAR
jgi:DNA-binding transcriptional LysR family regulator